MPFGIIGRTGPGIRQVVGFGDRSTGMGTFGGEFGARHCPQGPIGRTCGTAPRRGPLAKLLWADLLLTVSMLWFDKTYTLHRKQYKCVVSPTLTVQQTDTLVCG